MGNGSDTQDLVGTFYSSAEEQANVVTHLLGLLLSIGGSLYLFSQAKIISTDALVTGIVYVSGLILMFAMSLAYHTVPTVEGKRLWRKFDHAGIYYFIAASYTPILWLMIHRGGMLTFIWLFAAIGIVFKLFFTGRFDNVGLVSYLVMGWLGVAVMPEVWQREPLVVWWMLAGGIAFSAGVLFFVWERLPFNHAIWHIFVVAGCVCHYFAIVRYVIPTVNV